MCPKVNCLLFKYSLSFPGELCCMVPSLQAWTCDWLCPMEEEQNWWVTVRQMLWRASALGIPWWSNGWDSCSIPGTGTKILQATQCGQNKTKTNNNKKEPVSGWLHSLLLPKMTCNIPDQGLFGFFFPHSAYHQLTLYQIVLCLLSVFTVLFAAIILAPGTWAAGRCFTKDGRKKLPCGKLEERQEVLLLGEGKHSTNRKASALFSY